MFNVQKKTMGKFIKKLIRWTESLKITFFELNIYYASELLKKTKNKTKKREMAVFLMIKAELYHAISYYL